MFLHSLFQRQGWNAARNQDGRSRPDNASPRHSKPRARFVPRLEALEDRTVPSYVFQTIDDPSGAQGTEPIDINSSGQIVGYYVDAGGVLHSYLQIGSQYTTIDPPNESTVNPFSLAGGINAAGQIAGNYRGTDGVRHGYLLSDGQYTTFDDPLAVHGTRAFGINAQGQITGFYRDANFTARGFLLKDGQYIPVDDPNAGSGAFQGTLPFQINASGQITGVYIDANNLHHSFLLSGGQYTTIDDPLGALGTEGSGINDSGRIVGGYFSADGQTHGYIQVGNQFTTVDDPLGVGFSYADGINDPGQIVGVYLDATGFEHGFLATPSQSNSASAAIAARVPSVVASNLLNPAQPSLPANPSVGSPTLPAPRPGSSLALSTVGATAAVYAGAADAMFAASHTTSNDNVGLFAPLGSGSLDGL
jgi:uncharacterized membrane protein